MTREVAAEGSKDDFKKAFKKVAKEKPEKAKRWAWCGRPRFFRQAGHRLLPLPALRLSLRSPSYAWLARGIRERIRASAQDCLPMSLAKEPPAMHRAGVRDKFCDCRCLSAASAQRVEADDATIILRSPDLSYRKMWPSRGGVLQSRNRKDNSPARPRRRETGCPS